MTKLIPLLRDKDNKYHIRTLQSLEIDGYSLENFVIDLSGWMLQFSSNTRMIQMKASTLANTSPCQLANLLESRVRNREFPHLIVLLEGDASAVRECLREEHDTPPIAVLGFEDQAKITESSNPLDAFRNAIVSQLPISLLTPYETAAFVQGNRFFGRKRELQIITHNPHKSHSVIGIRRIGKTSLMHELERRLRDKTEFTLYIDCSRSTPYDLVHSIASELYNKNVEDLKKHDTHTFFITMMKAIRGSTQYAPIILLDEIDDLIDADSPSLEIFDLMRQMSQDIQMAPDGICQFIFAGHRRLWNAQYAERTPFFNWTDPVNLKPFARKDAELLITGPMKSMGVAIEEGVVDRIYRETGGHPNLIQYYCKIMIDHIEAAEESKIRTSAFDGIYGNEDFRQRLVTSFLHNTSPLEQALIYAIVLKQQRDGWEYHAQIKREDIINAIKESDIHAQYRNVDDALELLLLAGILLRTGTSYRFNYPIFAKLVSEDQPEYALEQLKAEGF